MPGVVYPGPLVVGVVFLIASTLKATEPGAALGAMIAAGAPPEWALATLPLLVGVEAGMGAALVLTGFLPWLRVSAGVFLAVMTGYLLVLVASGTAPDCGCFGKVRLFESARAEAWFGAARNLVLAALLLPRRWASMPPSAGSIAGPRDPS